MAVTRRQYHIGDAQDFYNFCQAELLDVGKSVFPSQVKKYEKSSRSFFYCEAAKRDRADREVATVKATMKVRCVAGTGKSYKIKTRRLTCSCDYCWCGVGDCCKEKSYVLYLCEYQMWIPYLL